MDLMGRRITHTKTDIRSEFRAAWDRIEIHAQSIHSTNDGAIQIVEALTRWRRSPGELWAPGLVIPIAEEMGLAQACSSWATELALADWSTTAHRAAESLIELNIQPAQLAAGDFVERTRQIMLRLGVDARELVLAIPDRLGGDGCRRAVASLEPLTSAGAIIAIDDHQGSSSTTSPDSTWLPWGSIIKLDPALTANAHSGPAAELLLTTVFSLHLDGYQVVAKSIDTTDQLTSVITAGIDLAQGSLFKLPVPLRGST